MVSALAHITLTTVGCRYYQGTAHKNEIVELIREPQNQYDRNAIRVDNIAGVQIGHIKRQQAAVLAHLLDTNMIDIEPKVQDNPTNVYEMKLIAIVYAEEEKSSEIIQTLKRGRMGLKILGKKKKLVKSSVIEEKKKKNVKNSVIEGKKIKSQEDFDALFEKMAKEKEIDEMPDPIMPLMKANMYAHQMQGVKWMLNRELQEDMPALWESVIEGGKRMYFNVLTRSSTELKPKSPKGGLLCDQMGVGKTLQILGLILANPVNSERYTEEKEEVEQVRKKVKLSDSEYTATLIVCPMSVLMAWQSQIEEHIESRIMCSLYHGSSKPSSAVLSNSDIVLTTYGTITSEFKLPKNNRTLQRVQWRRIVLDEGHTIRNRSSRGHKAIMELNSLFKWSITGTPFVNKPDDLYSQFRFIGMEPFQKYTIWKHALGRPAENGDGTAISALRLILESVCLRRLKAQVCNLPPINVKWQKIEMFEDQRKGYDVLFEAAKCVFRTASLSEKGKDGVMKNLSTVLECLLRLRQYCCDPSLVSQERMTAALNILEECKSLKKQANSLTPEEAQLLLAKLKEILNPELENSDGESYDCGICLDVLTVEQTRMIMSCKHCFCINCITTLLEMDNGRPSNCPFCRGTFTETDLVSASHILEQALTKHDLEKESEDIQKVQGKTKSYSSAKVDCLIQNI